MQRGNHKIVKVVDDRASWQGPVFPGRLFQRPVNPSICRTLEHMHSKEEVIGFSKTIIWQQTDSYGSLQYKIYPL